MSYIDVTGKTEEEAIRKALEQLGMDRDDVSVEILERAESGFLGFGGNPARVRVTYGPEEAAMEEPAAPMKPDVPPARESAAPEANVPVRRENAHRSERKAEKREKPEKAEKAEKVEKTEKKEPAPAEASAVPAMDLPLCEDENAQRIRAFLSGLLTHLEVKAESKVYELEKGHYQVILEGEKLGALIGRRGETLDAIQQLTNYAVNDRGDKRIRIHLDAENYRAKREASLKSLAAKVAAKVTKYHRSVTLEPMNAYERHVIHAALQEYDPAISTYSTGTEPNRRIVVAYSRSGR